MAATTAEADPLDVLFEDAHILAVAKPAGVLTQGTASGEPTLENAVRRYLGRSDPSSVYIGTVHRLDRPVSGVVLWARTPKAARRLSDQFAGRLTVKEYWAIIEARATPPAPGDSGVWDDWLAGSTDASGVVRVSEPGEPRARRAVTRYGRDCEGARLPEGAVWLKLWPETGRTHQLRVQAGLRGLPVWGDVVYGSTREFAQGIALHARSLTFEHPALRRSITVTAPLPPVWEGLGLVPP
jgi:23S rRNA pseudouridine1911/1915/1917 synthase